MGLDKKYVDRQIEAADPEDHKSSVRFATIAALPAYNRVGNVLTKVGNGVFPAIDGIVSVVGNSFLLTSDGSQAPADNGIYTITTIGSGAAPWVATRRTDADANDLVNSGLRVTVEEGTRYPAGTEFVLTTPNPIVLNTTGLVFEEVVGDTGGFISIPTGTRKTIKTDQQVVHVGPLTINGTLVVNGSFVTLPEPEYTQNVPTVFSGPYSAPNNSNVPVDPTAGALTVLLPPTGTPGHEIVIKNVSSSVNAVTIDGQGAKIDGAYTKTINTAFELIRVRRKPNQQWDVVN
jgi:hypothetical protein